MKSADDIKLANPAFFFIINDNESGSQIQQ